MMFISGYLYKKGFALKFNLYLQNLLLTVYVIVTYVNLEVYSYFSSLVKSVFLNKIYFITF